jgi:hypothetical protein
VGLQLVNPPNGDLVGLPALTSTSQAWSFPIVTTGGEIDLSISVSLFNPGKDFTAVSVKAFDTENNSLGIIEAIILLPGAVHSFAMANLEGIIPPQAALFKVTADAPINQRQGVWYGGSGGRVFKLKLSKRRDKDDLA